MLNQAIQRISNHQPWRLRQKGREAAVLIPITRSESHPELILTVRASHLNTHKGEVCFPGGKRDESDASLSHTALREADEEIGLSPTDVELYGPLGQVVSKHHLQVTPWVGLIPEQLPLCANPAEIARIFKVPVRFFIDHGPPHLDQIAVDGQIWDVPSWQYEGEVIWGLTAYIICELLTVGFGMKISMPTRPERGFC
ncbi:DNA mismatch repair protein MutT [Nitrincola sp. A-D6]|uniref:CoA pyrophosphatase n=1 Tax=Nitrincola sp. A-D6 TaxID=1545442 RepID=UPI00051FC4C8|nr:CoA pyrophosphatase [Nitrincola sp. A-D6]KGK42654.1 DNA mismatch repair protein MutT [Nitrincola sp. A-D6]